MTHTRKTARLGLLLPSSNSTQEPEFMEVMPRNISLHCARLSLSSVDSESTVKIVEELEHESRKLAHADVGVIVLAATAPTSRKGMGYDQELIRRIEAASGRRATTASTAMLEAFATLGIRSVALAAPWSADVNAGVATFLAANGIAVVAQSAMGLVVNNDIGVLEPESAFQAACKVDTPEADAVFLACGNWWSLSVAERIEQELGKPVLTTNMVSLWAALRILGHREPLPGYGALLGRHLPALAA